MVVRVGAFQFKAAPSEAYPHEYRISSDDAGAVVEGRLGGGGVFESDGNSPWPAPRGNRREARFIRHVIRPRLVHKLGHLTNRSTGRVAPVSSIVMSLTRPPCVTT